MREHLDVRSRLKAIREHCVDLERSWTIVWLSQDTAPLLKKIAEGEIDPSYIITQRLPLEDAPGAYQTFRDKRDGCIKVILKP